MVIQVRLIAMMVKNYYLKKNKKIKVIVGPSESMSKSKKIQLIQKV